MKSRKPFFSYQYLAQKAGFKAKSFIYKVIKGEKSLSQNSTFRVAQACNLTRKEIDYFEALVHFTESSTAKEKEYYFERMQQTNDCSEGTDLLRDQFNYLSKWYFPVIREIATVVPFGKDYKKLARALRPAISPKQAKEAIQLLEKLGILRKSKNNGLYEQTNAYLTTRNNVLPIAVNKFHRETLDLAQKALDAPEKKDRDFSTLTVGISSKGFDLIKEELKKFRNQISKIVIQDVPVEHVYQINFQMFQVSNLKTTDKKD
jgi:uncharacterized protein (TIGR02147 family)